MLGSVKGNSGITNSGTNRNVPRLGLGGPLIRVEEEQEMADDKKSRTKSPSEKQATGRSEWAARPMDEAGDADQDEHLYLRMLATTANSSRGMPMGDSAASFRSGWLTHSIGTDSPTWNVILDIPVTISMEVRAIPISPSAICCS